MYFITELLLCSATNCINNLNKIMQYLLDFGGFITITLRSTILTSTILIIMKNYIICISTLKLLYVNMIE